MMFQSWANSSSLWCWLSGIVRIFADLSPAVALELDFVGVVDEAIEDGIGHGWIADNVEP